MRSSRAISETGKSPMIFLITNEAQLVSQWGPHTGIALIYKEIGDVEEQDAISAGHESA